MATVAELVVRLKGDIKDFVDKMDTAEKRMDKTGRQMQRGVQIAGVAAAAALGLSVKAFSNFDAGMTQSLAIMGDVSDSMREEMSSAARKMALETTFSAREAADSYFFLASAGLSAEASVAALPAVAKFAQAGMFDMARATDLLTDSQSALGLAVRDDAGKNLTNMIALSDKLVKANTIANASVEQFAEALTNRAAAATRQLGKDASETLAVLAAFADQGIKGAEAGTRLDIVWRDLQTKAKENADVFEDVGVAVFDAAGEMRNTADIIAQLEVAFDGQSDSAKRGILTMLGFSDRSVAATLALIGTSDAIREYQRELENAQGITEEVAENQLETLNAQLNLLKSEFLDIGIELGSRVTPALMKMVSVLRSIPAPVKAMVAGFLILGTIAAALLVSIPAIISGFGLMGVGAVAAAGGLATAGAAMAAFMSVALPIAGVIAGITLAIEVLLRALTGKGIGQHLRELFESTGSESAGASAAEKFIQGFAQRLAGEKFASPELTFPELGSPDKQLAAIREAAEAAQAKLDEGIPFERSGAGGLFDTVAGKLGRDIEHMGPSVTELRKNLEEIQDLAEGTPFKEQLEDDAAVAYGEALAKVGVVQRDATQGVVELLREMKLQGATMGDLALMWDKLTIQERAAILQTTDLGEAFTTFAAKADVAINPLTTFTNGLLQLIAAANGATGALGGINLANLSSFQRQALDSLENRFGIDVDRGDLRQVEFLLGEFETLEEARKDVAANIPELDKLFANELDNMLGRTAPVAARFDEIGAAADRLLKTRANNEFGEFVKAGPAGAEALRRRNQLIDNEFQQALSAWAAFGGDVRDITFATFEGVIAEMERAATQAPREADFLSFLQARRQGGLANTGDGSFSLPFSGATLGGASTGTVNNSVTIGQLTVAEGAESRVPAAILATTAGFAGAGAVTPRPAPRSPAQQALEDEGIFN